MELFYESVNALFNQILVNPVITSDIQEATSTTFSVLDLFQ
jgi:hypothetical protein